MPCLIYSKQISDGQPSLSKRSKNGRMPRRTSNCDQEWISCCPIKRATPLRHVSTRLRTADAHSAIDPARHQYRNHALLGLLCNSISTRSRSRIGSRSPCCACSIIFFATIVARGSELSMTCRTAHASSYATARAFTAWGSNAGGMDCSLLPGGSTNISQSPAPVLVAALGDTAILAPLPGLFKQHFCVTGSNADQVSTPGHQPRGISRSGYEERATTLPTQLAYQRPPPE